MKDIEKIKSEDLAAQVQDANPANFAIEQEVAAMVGATVPQPTQPSADDARELGAQLLVFLRRALTPIQSALRTAVAAIYAHLDSRCTAYTPAAYAPYSAARRAYDPMGNLPPRSVANLLTAITAFSARKISDLGDCPDGISLVHLLQGDNTSITEIKDDNAGWELKRAFPASMFPNVSKLTCGAGKIEGITNFSIFTSDALTNLSLPHLKIYSNRVQTGQPNDSGSLINGTNIETITIPEIEEIHTDVNSGSFIRSQVMEECYMPSLKDIRCSANSWTYRPYSYASPLFRNCPALKVVVTNIERMCDEGSFIHSSVQCFRGSHALQRFVFGTLKSWDKGFFYQTDGNMDDFIDLEIGAGTAINLDFTYWNPTNVLADADKTATFLQNFREHIALRLTDQGSGKTLTLSQAVFSAVIEGSSPICDDIKGIIEDKGWKVQDTNNNIFPTT